MEVDYKEKIRRLLALAESPEEHEARAALLKARELMAKHKLTERECRDAEPEKVVRVYTKVTCSKRRDPWAVALSAIIGENHCCKAVRTHRYKCQTNDVGFIGFEDDAALCVQIFEYAVDCIHAETKRIRQENSWADASFVTRKCDSFGYGFAAGLKQAFAEQNEEKAQEWGLVLVTPKEVQEAADKVGKPSAFHSRSLNGLIGGEYASGFQQGQEFDPHRRLKEV